MKNTLRTTTILALAISLPASGAIVFTEDFESYAPGSNLRGQGGWLEAGSDTNATSVVTIASGNFLSSRVINGRAATGLSQENILEHPVTLNTTGIFTLKFTAYASTVTLPTHNQTVGFVPVGRSIDGTEPDPYGTNYPNARWGPANNSPGGQRWSFFTGTNVFSVPGGYDTPVNLSIVVDRFGNRIYGQYDLGNGLLETPHYKVSSGYIAALNAIQLFVDHRNPSSYTGMEVDNITVSVDPAVKIRRAVEICWFAETNTTYRVDYQSQLATNTWNTLINCIQGAGAPKQIYDSAEFEQRFYRVVEADCIP